MRERLRFRRGILTICGLGLLLLTTISVWAQDQGTFSTTPSTNNGKKWRIGYYEGGEYTDYQKSLIATVSALMEMGWIVSTDIPKQSGEQTVEFWKWLATSIKSDSIEFVADAYYSAKWDENARKQLTTEIIKRLNEKNDIDVMIACGTWAGQDMATDKHHTPTIVISTSDPIAAGIIKSVEDSGHDHIHAMNDPFLFEHQIRLFHEIIGFQRLGVAYENTLTGRSYAAVDKIEQLRQELGFEFVSCYTQSDIADIKIAQESVKTCFQELGNKADAIYVTQQSGVNKESISALVDIANAARIPTFSQAGSDEVKNGILLSISLAGFKYVGNFYAETLAKIMNGAKPHDISQLFENPPKIAINLKTAELIGYDPPVDVLGAADEIFQEIIPVE